MDTLDLEMFANDEEIDEENGYRLEETNLTCGVNSCQGKFAGYLF